MYWKVRQKLNKDPGVGWVRIRYLKALMWRQIEAWALRLLMLVSRVSEQVKPGLTRLRVYCVELMPR